MRSRIVCRLGITCVIFVSVLLAIPCAASEPGVFPDKLVVGSPSDKSGTTAFDTKCGLGAGRAYFQKAYDEKLYPRKIVVVAEDNGYNPAKTIKAAKLLLDKHKIFLFWLCSGTSASMALNSILEENHIPLVGEYTHAEVIAVPPKKYMFQMHTTYPDQVKIAVDYIVEKAGKKAKIAAFYQDDDFGADGMRGFTEQMKKYGMKPSAEVSFKRGAIDLSSQALKLKRSKADYVIMISLWTSAARLMKEAKKLDWKPQFVGIGPTVDENIFKLAGDAIDYGKPFLGVAIQYPWWGDSKGSKEFRAAMKKYAPDVPLGTFTQWAYAYAKILVEALSRIKGEPTREKVVAALESFKDYDTGVFPPLTWGPNLRKGTRSAQIWTVKNGKFEPITGWRQAK